MMSVEISELEAEKPRLKAELEENKKRYGQAKKYEKKKIDVRQIEIHSRLEEIEENLRNYPLWRDSARNFEWGNDFGGSDEDPIDKTLRSSDNRSSISRGCESILHEA